MSNLEAGASNSVRTPVIASFIKLELWNSILFKRSFNSLAGQCSRGDDRDCRNQRRETTLWYVESKL